MRTDVNRTGKFVRLFGGEHLKSDEIIIRFRVRGNRVKFASNAYFFEEGHASDYAKARYAAFRVDSDGDVLLSFLLDERLRRLPLKRREK